MKSNSTAPALFAVTPFTRQDRVWLLAVVLLAAGLRFAFPGIVDYFHDDAMLATLAQETVGGAFPLTGILSSTGIPNPPTSVYVMAVPFALSPDPVVAILFVMALNIAGVACLWIITHRYIGRRVGIIAGMLYAVSPWAIWYSRKIWAQDFHTPFVLLAVLLLLIGIADRRPHRWAQVLALPVAFFAMQIHFAAWALLPMFVLLLWHYRQRVWWQALFAGFIGSLIVLAPYLTGLGNTLRTDPTRISDALNRTNSVENASGIGQSLLDVFVLASGGIAPITANVNAPPHIIAYGGTVIFSLLLLAGTVLITRKRSWWLLWWAFAPAIALIVPVTPVYLHYFVASIPACLILIAFAADKLVDRAPTRWQKICVPMFAIVCGLQVLHWSSVLNDVNQTPYAYPAFTTPLNRLLPIRDALAQRQDVIVLSAGMAWDRNHEVAVWETLLHERVACVRTLSDDSLRVFPQQAYAVLQAPDAPSELVNAYTSGTPDTVFPTRSTDAYRLFVYDDHAGLSEDDLAAYGSESPVDFDNGATLLGYQRANDGMRLLWRLNRLATRGADYQYTIQAFDAQGARIAQYDRLFWQGIHWCPGDILQTQVPFVLPADAAHLMVGMYQLNDDGTISGAKVLTPQNGREDAAWYALDS